MRLYHKGMLSVVCNSDILFLGAMKIFFDRWVMLITQKMFLVSFNFKI